MGDALAARRGLTELAGPTPCDRHSVDAVLTPAEVDAFEQDGFVPLRGAIPADVVAACQTEIEAELRAQGVERDDPTTWSRPVVRFLCPWTPAFETAGTQATLHEAYDQLVGPGRWLPVRGVGGTIPVRFPHPDDPGDAGWHIDGSYLGPDGTWWVNVGSKERGLLGLLLFDDISPDDAPTELLIGSHLDVPPVVLPFGEDGASFATIASGLPAHTFDRPSTFATGQAGDVYVCHPFLVHRATWPHRGSRPRAVAQPGVAIHEPFPLDGVDPGPVERAILAGLSGAGAQRA